jgi:DNA-binding PadR family transcriptional regulator
MPASTTFRHKGGGARISVNLTPEGLKALEYLIDHGQEAKGAINQAIIAAARESWEENERQAREDAR